ncbi:MAG: protein-L-isoaspartate O-methyltransferase [Candidatus Komeilibacteria bacterium CG10_big_fil_rev_8_21_14_0_10_41_13]|uniref:Protein-L-isoaspartate O-methyltransferase n=1 Tax=Candidatus Komeilibacteria bacterium CG10_big_fil_rev_8_21_14_0_10_41_13 TaxID=1974476 RepID=A0A2M6WCH5_9BACT|nr:MAG: protein-L-isoaspartate O-methyltransferase [Candidatus Komeilibacteria bacterium CG10_big_fil_rev_8_21_14_0_10_41_13]
MTNQDLINELLKGDYLNTLRIIKAFEKVDRADFVMPADKDEAYENFPLEIGHGQTISQPATVAFMLEKLQPEVGNKVLDVGSGSGWQTALLSEIVGDKGEVIGLEIRDELVELGRENLKKYNFSQGKIIKGNGWQGLAEEAPFDRIIVAAAAETIPDSLKQQLKIGGRLVIPVGRGMHDIIVIDRLSKDNFEERYYPGFSFVPLINF